MSHLIETCPIPTGAYPIGDDRTPASRPQHMITLDAYSMGKTAVSNAQFAEFLLAGGYEDESLWTEMGWRWLKANPDKKRPSFLADPRFNHPFQPVVGIGWYDAVAFTRWLSRETGETWRLPSEVEWEAACRGQHAVIINAPHTNTAERGTGHPWKVTEGAVSWCGMVAPLGNVWEWTLSRWGRSWQTLEYPYPYDANDGREEIEGSHARVMRGGSYFDSLTVAVPAHRGRYLPGSRGSNIGFRVLREGGSSTQNSSVQHKP